MRLREYKSEEYGMICEWWKAHQWTPVPEIALSRTGLIAETDDGEPCAVIWIYQTDSPVMLAEWMVTNPENSDMTSYKAVTLLLKGVKDISNMSNTYLMTFLQEPSLVKIFQKHGFEVEEIPYTIAHYGG